MTKILEGALQAKDMKFAVVVARFNDFIGVKLLEGALDTLRRHGTNLDDCTIAWVPGSFEIPLIAKQLALSGTFNAILTLGVVIRGSTPHFDYVAAEVSKGIAQVALETGIPVIFGVLTTDTIEQAIERAGTKAGNKGMTVALAAIEMVDLLHKMKN